MNTLKKTSALTALIALLFASACENEATDDDTLLNNGKTSEVTISLDKTALTLFKGETAVLAAAVTPEGAGAEITWYSTDSDIATVSADGTVTAVQTGAAEIVARIPAGDGEKTAACAVTVPKDPGLYETGVHREAAGTSLADMFAWIAANGVDDTAYTLVLGADETITEPIGIGTGATATSQGEAITLNTGTPKNLTIIMEGAGNVTITMTGQHSLFTAAGGTEDIPTLILENGVTLKGNETNRDSLVVIGKESTKRAKFEMREGSRITGNTSNYLNLTTYEVGSEKGGGVHIAQLSEFLMTGGSIDHNKIINRFTGPNGGGVFAHSFTMSGTARVAGNQAKAGAGVHIKKTFIMTGGVIENNTIYAEYAATTMHPYIYGGAGVFMARYNTAPHTFVKTGGVIRGMTGPDANTIAGGLSAFTHPVEAIQFYFSDRRTAWYPNTVYYWADGAGATENINFDVNITQNSGTDVGNVITCADGLLRVEE